MAIGKRKHLLSKVNEKKSTEVRETIENDYTDLNQVWSEAIVMGDTE
jgi:SHS2 domain-containing protein